MADQLRPVPEPMDMSASTPTFADDVSMGDAVPVDQSAADSLNAPGTGTGTPARANSPARGRGVTQENGGSRAASVQRDAGFSMPDQAEAHGAPVRQYLNSKVTKTLMEGMKMIAKEQPKDPLRVLGEFLLQRSAELESTNITGT